MHADAHVCVHAYSNACIYVWLRVCVYRAGVCVHVCVRECACMVRTSACKQACLRATYSPGDVTMQMVHTQQRGRLPRHPPRPAGRGGARQARRVGAAMAGTYRRGDSRTGASTPQPYWRHRPGSMRCRRIRIVVSPLCKKKLIKIIHQSILSGADYSCGAPAVYGFS